ncbi:MAG: murein biosynthesis integral membrane protein MurJ [Abditibacteriota bacterium]|nr:murein biosynthesis integral membrane protein MurJ [Abditibacteriota bacterium]
MTDNNTKGPSNKAVTRAAGLMMVAILASRLLGLFRDMAMAGKFGQGALVSAYTVSFNLPDLLYFFLSSGALSGAFIPVFTEKLTTGKKKEGWEIFSIILCFMLLVLGGFVILTEIYAAPLVKTLVAPGYAHDDPELIALIVKLTRIVLPCQVFFFLGGLMMGTLESRQNFKARAAGPVIYNLGIIFGVLFLSKYFSIAGLSWGALIGAFVGNILFPYYHLRKEGYEFYPSLNLRHPGVVKVAILAVPVILGLSLPQIDVIINRWFATWVSEDAPGALNYANRLMQVPLGVFAQAAGTAILPTLAAYAAQGRIDKLRDSLSFGLRSVLALNIPASFFLAVLADPIVRTVYMHGRFTSADVGMTAFTLAMYSVGIFAWAGQAIVARGFFALQDTVTPVVIGSVVTVIFVPMNILLVKPLGTGGLALATSLMAALHLALLIFCLRKRIGGMDGKRVMTSAVKITAASVVMSLVCLGLMLCFARTMGTHRLQFGDVKNVNEAVVAMAADRETFPTGTFGAETTKAIAAGNAMKALEGNMRMGLINALNGKIDDGSLLKYIDNSMPKKIRKAKDVDPKNASRRVLEELLPGCVAPVTPEAAFVRAVKNTKVIERANNYELLAEDLTNPVKAADLIANGDTEIAEALRTDLAPSVLGEITAYDRAAKEAEESEKDFLHDLNIAITTKDLAGAGIVNVKANREYLAQKYPDFVTLKPVWRVESKSASAAEVLITMFIASLVYFVTLKLLKAEEADVVMNTVKRRLGRKKE